MKPVWLPADQVVPFVAHHIGVDPDFGRCVTLAVIDKKGAMAAGVILNDWDPRAGTICMSAASVSPRWATREVLREITGYCFNRAGCQMIVARHAETNTPARRFWKAVGAEEYIIPRLRGRNENEAIATLTHEAWLNSKFVRH